MGEESYERHLRRCCSFCDSPASSAANLMKCSGCLIAYYCNRDHQVADWKRHKQLCKELQAKRTMAEQDAAAAAPSSVERINALSDQVIVEGPAIQSTLCNSEGCSQTRQSIHSKQGTILNQSVKSAVTDRSIKPVTDRSVTQLPNDRAINSVPVQSVPSLTNQSRPFPAVNSSNESMRSPACDTLNWSRQPVPISSDQSKFGSTPFPSAAAITLPIIRSSRSPIFSGSNQSIPPPPPQTNCAGSVETTRVDVSNRSPDNRRSTRSILVSATSSANVKSEHTVSGCAIVDKVHQRTSVIQTTPVPVASAAATASQESQKRSRAADQQRSGAPPPGPKRARRAGADRSTPSLGNTCAAGSSRSIDDEYGPKKDHSLNHPLDLDRDSHFRSGAASTSMCGGRHDVTSSRLAKMAQFVAASLREYGWAVVDKFIGASHCRAVLKEIQTLHERGDFAEAKLLTSKSGTQLQGVRSDAILFLSNGSDDGIHIGLLVAIIDSLIFQIAGSVPPYNICGRTRPMLTCYPGQRSRYITHVDNPDKDGRCITATYYLNEDWRPAHGGLLRLFPVSAFKPVDVEPIFDRLVLYWSDRRNPHEILPSYRKRFSINIWYFDSDEKAAADARELHCDSISPGQKSCSL